jgi:DNA-binding beta-propeller fold protein YncE
LGTGTKGSADGQFNHPAGVAVDPGTSDVYVADSGSLGDNNDGVQKFDRNGHFILKWGSSGSSNGQFGNPNDVAVDSKGDVYVSDLNNHRIQKFKSNGGFIKKWGQLGAGDGEFNHPAGIDVDSSDNLYVADVNNQRIQKFASNGIFITKFGSPGSDDGQFNLPAGLSIDSRGEVYVADRHNHRIQVFALQQSCPTESSEVIEKPEPKAAGFLQDRTNPTKAGVHTTEGKETKC